MTLPQRLFGCLVLATAAALLVAGMWGWALLLAFVAWVVGTA